MPYLCEKLHIPETKDRRVKLTQEDKEFIRDEYKRGGTSHRKLAVKYGVSKRLIGFILNPETLKKNYENRVARGGSKQYYDKDSHRIAMKTHRAYKQSLYLKGELI
jgi:hypothetical protein